MHLNLPKFIKSSIIISALGLSTVAYAQTSQTLDIKVDGNKPVVRVGSALIREGDIALAMEALGGRLGSLDASVLRERAIEYLIDRKLAVIEAERLGVDERPEARRAASYYIEEAVRQIYMLDFARSQITEEKLRKWYEELIKELSSQPELKAAHILVKEKGLAEELARRARNGEDFAKLAADYSTGPSKSKGGDLGWFSPQQMVPEFSKAALKLKVSGISDPIKTQFGWHVIKLEDKRKAKPPTFEQVRPQAERTLSHQAVQGLIKKLRENVSVVRLDKQ